MPRHPEDQTGREARSTQGGDRERHRPLSASAVADYLRRHPGFLAELLSHDIDLVRHLRVPAPDQKQAARAQAPDSSAEVVDLQTFLVERLRGEVDRLQTRLDEAVRTSRINMAAQQRAQAAVIAFLAATSFEELVEIVTADLGVLLDVDVVTLCVEAEGEVPNHATRPGVQVVAPGSVDAVLGVGRAYKCAGNIVGDPLIFGHGAGLVRSHALLRLDVSSQTPPGLLAIGSRREGHFDEGQAMDTMNFMARSLELTIRAWLDVPLTE